MKLDHLPLETLKPSKLNVRKKGGRKTENLTASIKAHGILQPLLVRPDEQGYEIIAGQRRYHALSELADDDTSLPVPCIIMEEGDDVMAVEASLAENIMRLPMDEIDQYKAFSSLIAKGETVQEIAGRFDVSERAVNQRLAIARIIEPVLNAYRRGDIDAQTLRALTLASKQQQKEWYRRWRSDDEHAPLGYALRRWLMGGGEIPMANALFDVSEYTGTIISDLFEDNRYFSDAELFWACQNRAIAAARQTYLAGGWSGVDILEVGQYWHSWDHVKVPKTKGGKVYVQCAMDGEVTFHEGYLTTAEARKLENADSGEEAESKPARPELTKAMANYIGLHRHAAVRTELLEHPRVALRLAVAHIIAGSANWSVTGDAQRADRADIHASVEISRAEQAFRHVRAKTCSALGIEIEPEDNLVPGTLSRFERPSVENLFGILQDMDNDQVMDVLTFVMAETLAVSDGTVDMLGGLFGTDMREWWQADEVFFALMRDKEALGGMAGELAGQETADAHTTSTAKVLKKIISDCLDGTRKAVLDNWLPRYFRFPAEGYTGRYQ